ncbi:Ger(x)C family spore germination protein [Paenibacillus silvisoli]|uniref:Ger(x)C family spore germination protein n=1 Tax=Paenibacillus silvisoli TaxID=3110539 RepID=UPI00280590EE|nr:Ger(x)C family spore germination protein [Paenibacillus silvisoli]
MKPFLCICLLFAVMLLSGCWDRTEINDLAFVTGASFDLADNGEYNLSLQIAIPSPGQGGAGGGGNGHSETFFVLSAVGKNANEAFEMIQKQSSRKLFTAHRSVIFISEACGKHGINDILDVFIHDPRQRLKTYMLVVKGGTGREILETSYPFEQLPVEAIKEMEGIGGELATTLRDFFIAASSPGINPIMGVIEDARESKVKKDLNKTLKLAGSAIFKQTQLIGLLDGNETAGLLWATDQMKNGRISAKLPGGNGIVSMVLSHSSRRMITEIHGERIKVTFLLEGKGSLVENISNFDISRPQYLKLAQNVMEQSVQNQVKTVVNKLHKQYKVDSVGVGQDIFRNHPRQWKTLQNQWENRLPGIEVAVKAKLSIGGAGMAGAPLQLKEKEIIK